MIIWIQFLACTAIIFLSGTRLSRYGDVIAEKTGMGRTWIGVILMASVTSLPELITGISSVAIYDVPNIAAGDVLGSCMFNILIIALLDFLDSSSPIAARASPGQVLTAAFGVLLLAMVSLSIMAGPVVPAIGWIGIYTPFFIIVYLLSMRLVFVYERRRIAEFMSDVAEEAQYGEVSKARAYSMYAVNAALIIAAATYLPSLGERIAEMTGLGKTFVGSIFIATSTSLPELVVSLAALRLGAVDLVFGNVLGSNLFNIGILALDDIVYTRGPLLSVITPNHAITAVSAIIMTSIAVIGLTFRSSKKRFYVGWDSIAIIAAYISTTYLLFVTR